MNRTIAIAVVSLLAGLVLGLGLSQVLNGAPDPAPEQGSGGLSSVQAAEPLNSTDVAGQTGDADAALSADATTGADTGDGAADTEGNNAGADAAAADAGSFVSEDGTYTSKDEVAAYIHTFGHLPSNYISKTKARAAGWVAKDGNLDEVLPGKSIGGSEFYNDEGLLPDAPGRTWTECDINYSGGYRGAERIVFSNDGLVFYTADHYETFEQLY